ncbi:MAG: cysteine desulfurase [bacterium]|nr:cysteine desulfurase [bacterium]
MNKHYFDYAAATPMSPAVLKSMQTYYTDKFYNPSALYLSAQEVKSHISEARASLARILGAKSSEIVFTAGGTESDNLAIRGVMEQFPDANCIVSSIDHDAVLVAAKKYEHKIAPVMPDGRLDLAELVRLINDATVLISIIYANNEIGTIQPMHDIAKELDKIRQLRQESGNDLPLYLHTDACQAANTLPLLVNTLGVDLMTLNGGKIYGPKQSGILYVKTGTKLKAQIVGGGQERSLRSGTENVPAIIGFARALYETAEIKTDENQRLKLLQAYFIDYLGQKVPSALINGSLKHRLSNNIHITLSGFDNETLMMRLDEAGFMVATGSACSASSDEPSHVLKAIGLSDENARSSLRISLGRQSSEAEIKQLLDTLARFV